MKEPNRLLIQGATDAERVLLRSASADGPPDGESERMMAALDGVPGANGGASLQAQVAARSFEVAFLAKIGLVALLGVAGLVTGVMVHGRARARQAPVDRPPVQVERALGSTEAQGASEAAKPAKGTPSEPGSAARSLGLGLSDDSLSAELRVLDVARAAVDARNSAKARRALDIYAQRFPQGRLKLEAAVLRLAVLVRQGEFGAARSLGQALLASESYKTYQPRIRSLLREIRE